MRIITPGIMRGCLMSPEQRAEQIRWCVRHKAPAVGRAACMLQGFNVPHEFEDRWLVSGIDYEVAAKTTEVLSMANKLDWENPRQLVESAVWIVDAALGLGDTQ